MTQPVCPVANAKTVNSYIADSRLVVQDGPGVRIGNPRHLLDQTLTTVLNVQHCSLAQASLCTGKILRKYFIDGKLPDNGKVCPVTEITFPPKPPVDNGTSFAAFSPWNLDPYKDQNLLREDLALLQKLKAFGEAVQFDISLFKSM